MSEGVLCLLRLCEKGCAEIAPSSGFSAAKLMICQLTSISNICILSRTVFQCLDISQTTDLQTAKTVGCRTFSFYFQRKDPWKFPPVSPVFFSQKPQIVDVCGGHGALAMLCLAHGLGQEAKIIDPSKPPSYQRLCHLGW